MSKPIRKRLTVFFILYVVNNLLINVINALFLSSLKNLLESCCLDRFVTINGGARIFLGAGARHGGRY